MKITRSVTVIAAILVALTSTDCSATTLRPPNGWTFASAAAGSYYASLRLAGSAITYDVWYLYIGGKHVNHKTFSLSATGEPGKSGQAFRVASGGAKCGTAIVQQATPDVLILKLGRVDLHFAKVLQDDESWVKNLNDIARRNIAAGTKREIIQDLPVLPSCS